jgi:hypothetical protein
MEEYVAARHSQRPSQGSRQDDAEDTVEHGMRVPTSVLDGCGESFKAADEKREKASTQYFSDTRLMALLCRHDRVLWIVNMTHAGKRRHYALALINKLFQHIPPQITVGLLYDIGCQLHCSCLKWGFLQDYLHRLIFAISVFHAFGHQWPCQIIYHPRKCEGFGLTDGEGCERFWSAIRKLIPYLRVSGVSPPIKPYYVPQLTCLQYFQRLFMLDTQIKHLDQKSLENLGHWLRRRWYYFQRKKADVIAEMQRLGIPEGELRAEWAAQVREQTKPAPRKYTLGMLCSCLNCIWHIGRSKANGRRAVHAVLELMGSIDLQKKAIAKLEMTLAQTSLFEVTDLLEQLRDTREHIAHLEQGLSRKKRALGGGEQADLRKLQQNTFLRLRMNALALKHRLRDWLHQRKFEIEKLERSHRHSVNGIYRW